MIDLLLFASLREELGVTSLSLEAEEGMTIASLIDGLEQQRGQSWGELLRAANTVKAMNQSVVSFDAAVSDGDEVAFFPPVTGG